MFDIAFLKKYERTHFLLSGCFAFFMAFSSRIAAACVVLIALNWLFAGNLKKHFRRLLRPIPFCLIGFFLLHLIGIFYSNDLTEALRDVESKLSFVLLPAIYFTFPIADEVQRNKILKLFVTGCLLVALFCLIYGLWQYIITDDIRVLFYIKLGMPVSSHPTYFSVYTLLSFFIILKFAYQSWAGIPFLKKMAFIILLLFCVCFIILLSARISLLIFVCLFALTLLFFFYKKKGLLHAVTAMLLFFLTIGTMSLSFSVTKNRIQTLMTELKTNGDEANIRLRIWGVALTAIDASPLWGHGTGDIQEQLLRKYKERNIEEAFAYNYNVHNQYLQSWVALGVFAVLLLFISFMLPLYMAITQKSFLGIIFFATLLMVMLTESFLEREQGILFSLFFYCFFVTPLLYRKEQDVLK